MEDDDAETSKDFVEKEEKESTSLESYEKVKEEVVETFSEMTLWGEMHEELKNEKTIPTSEHSLEQRIERNHCKQKIKKNRKKKDCGRLCA